jgi:tungstate transport system substrate-binding protein
LEDEMIRRSIITIFTISILSLVLVAGCGKGDKGETVVLKMATTTSTDNTGLLDYLKEPIQEETNIDLQWVAVGTGKALKLGENCDVDILMVHAPAAEKKYVDKGALADRTEIMYNDFVIIGPPSDPAGIKGMSVTEAMKTVKEQKSSFASRGDDSGTHKKEKSLWKSADLEVPDKENWYIQTGQGMLATIQIATERKAYTMTDRGTYIKYEANAKGNPPLVILVEGDDVLKNQYSVLAVNPENCENVNYETSKKLIQWFTSDSAQKKIGDFKLMGKQLFTPNAK